MLDGTLQALADPTRRRVVELLRSRPRRAGEIAEAMGLSRPAMSRHLRILRKAKLVEPEGEEDDARARVYRLRPGAFGELRRWLEDVERFWTLELEAFKVHAEKRKGRS